MAATVTRTVDGRGRLTLGREFSDRLVMVSKISDGVLRITLAEAVPAREAWLYRNPDAHAAVMEGIEQAKAGQLVKGPDMKASSALAEDMEDG